MIAQAGQVPGLPTICDRCGRVFEHPFFHVGGPNLTIKSEGARIGPHPGCGGYGLVVPGVYEWLSDAVRVTFAALADPVDRIRIVDALERAYEARTDEEVEAALAEAPGLKKTLDELSQRLDHVDERLESADRVGRRRFLIGTLLAVVGTAASLFPVLVGEPSPSPSDAVVERATEEVLRELTRPLAPPIVPPAGPPAAATTTTVGTTPDGEKIGRNDPCWCGSGKKYKRCHGG